MLVFNFRFFLLNVLIWSIFMLGIKIRTFLSSTDPGVFQNVQLLNPRCTGSQEIKNKKTGTVLVDTLYLSPSLAGAGTELGNISLEMSSCLKGSIGRQNLPNKLKQKEVLRGKAFILGVERVRWWKESLERRKFSRLRGSQKSLNGAWKCLNLYQLNPNKLGVLGK